MLDYCKQYNCQGHLSKFRSCLDEALYTLALEGCVDASTGDVDWFYHADLVIQRLEGLRVPAFDDVLVVVPVGSYIVRESHDGFVSVTSYDSEADARLDFAELEYEYNEST